MAYVFIRSKDKDPSFSAKAVLANDRFPPIIAVNTLRVDVRFGEAAMVGWTAQMGATPKCLSVFRTSGC
jgi:hypothetical protein